MLSQAIQYFLPFKQLVKEILSEYGFKTERVKYFTHSTIFEDNQGILTVATSPRYTSTSKCIAVKYHFFCDKIGEDKGIVLKKVESENQIADIFTKGLTAQVFEPLRRKLMVW